MVYLGGVFVWACQSKPSTRWKAGFPPNSITIKNTYQKCEAALISDRRFDMTLENLEKRVRALEDIEEIKKLHRDYIFWLDDKEFEKMIDCFAEDATEEIGKTGIHKGKEEIAKVFREVIAQQPSAKGGHILVQPVISVEEDKAKGYWTMYRFDIFSTPAGQLVKWEQGRYDCEYIKENGKWKFTSLKYTFPWPEKPEEQA